MARPQKKPAKYKKRRQRASNSDLEEEVVTRPEKKPALLNLAEFYNSDPEESSKEVAKELPEVSPQPISKQEEDDPNDREDSEEFSEHDVEEEWDSPEDFLEEEAEEDEPEEYHEVEVGGKEEEEKEREDKMVKGLEDDDDEEERMHNYAPEPNDEEVEEEPEEFWDDDIEEEELEEKPKSCCKEEEDAEGIRNWGQIEKENQYPFAGDFTTYGISDPCQMYEQLMQSFFSSATNLSPAGNVWMDQNVPMAIVGPWNEWSGSTQINMQLEQQVIWKDIGKRLVVGDPEPLSELAAEYKSSSPILQEKIKLLGEQYIYFRRTSKDGNCFYRSFMFSYMEHILNTQNKVEVNRLLSNIENCKHAYIKLGDDGQQFEHQFTDLRGILLNVLQRDQSSKSYEELLDDCRKQFISDAIVRFFRLVTAIEIRKREEFFGPFLQPSTVDQFCRDEVITMGKYADQWQIVALSDALGVPIRIVNLDESKSSSGEIVLNDHFFFNPPPDGNFKNSLLDTPSGTSIDGSKSEIVTRSDPPQINANESIGASTSNSLAPNRPVPIVTLLYTFEHYDIIYPK